MKTCKNCQDRYLGCHSSCEDYKKYKNLKQIENINRNKNREFNNYVMDKKRSII